MENEIVVRSEYWKTQLSVKRRLGIPVLSEEVLFAYQMEIAVISEKLTLVFNESVDVMKQICEVIADATKNMFDNLSLAFRDILDTISDLYHKLN